MIGRTSPAVMSLIDENYYNWSVVAEEISTAVEDLSHPKLFSVRFLVLVVKP
jgi:hypothetical protein